MEEERHELDPTPDELLAEVRMLRTIVERMLLQLPDLAIEIVLASARDHVASAEREARRTDNDRWRNYAARAWGIAAELREAAGTAMAERAEGARITTIRAAPVDPADKRMRDLAAED